MYDHRQLSRQAKHLDLLTIYVMCLNRKLLTTNDWTIILFQDLEKNSPNVLENEKVFAQIPGREHKSFKVHYGLMEKLSKKDLLKKVEHTIKQLQSL